MHYTPKGSPGLLWWLWSLHVCISKLYSNHCIYTMTIAYTNTTVYSLVVCSYYSTSQVILHAVVVLSYVEIYTCCVANGIHKLFYMLCMWCVTVLLLRNVGTEPSPGVGVNYGSLQHPRRPISNSKGLCRGRYPCWILSSTELFVLCVHNFLGQSVMNKCKLVVFFLLCKFHLCTHTSV